MKKIKKLPNKELDVDLELTQYEFFYICRTLKTRNTKESLKILKEMVSTFLDEAGRFPYYKDLVESLESITK